MLSHPRRHTNAAGLVALGLGLLLLGCGSSSDPSSPNRDLAPTVTITDDVAAATATGPTTFTFTFSEAVDASFDSTQITLVSGTLGAFARVSDTVSTLVVDPLPNNQGTITLALAAGAFHDLAGNGNASKVGASQDYDTNIPTVVITDNFGGATATGPVTFTFTFSEGVDASFDASKIDVSGGVAGAFTRSNPTTSTLVVIPTANAAGTIHVALAPGAFKDLAGNASTASASASQACDTTVLTIPTVTITDNVVATTASSSVTFTFTFSEAIDATFNASKITVTGGTASTFTRASATVSTLVVTPPANQSGTLTVAVAAGAFKNLSGTGNTAAASASQNFLTGDPVPPYKDPSLAPEARVADLLARMTLDEKLGQMTQAERGAINGSPADIATYGLGSILSGGGSAPASNTPTGWATMVDGYQQQAMASRLGIPMIYGVDAVHGHNNAYGAVLFPHNIGLGAAHDADLVKRIGQATAEELKATGIRWTFAPCVAVPQDERWGRTYEGFGEATGTVTTLGVAYIQGLQGAQIDADSVIACAKHYMADGGTDGGVNMGNCSLSEVLLRAIHLPPYQAAVNRGVGTVMSSFSSWKGTPMRDSKYLLTDVLRGELGFDGFVVSDWNDIQSDVANGINSGVDMAMLSGGYVDFIHTLKTLVNAGTVPLTRIDEAVSRILLVKFRMGLFEHPYSDATFRTNFGTAAHRAIAREAVAKSAVLLKNATATLPIAASVHNILVTGSKADDIGIQCGGWSMSWQGGTGAITTGTTLREAITTAAASKGMTVSYSTDGSVPAGSTSPDLVIVAIGETPYAESMGDSGTLALPSADTTVFNAAKALGKPVVTVLFSGRPMVINDYLANSSAFLAAWLPGTEGGGIADLLFGAVKPSGKLPHTWPASLGQVPINQGDGQTGLFALGYGLTYP